MWVQLSVALKTSKQTRKQNLWHFASLQLLSTIFFKKWHLPPELVTL